LAGTLVGSNVTVLDGVP